MYSNIDDLSVSERRSLIRQELTTLQVPLLGSLETIIGRLGFADGQLLTLLRRSTYYELRSWMPIQPELLIEILQSEHTYLCPNGQKHGWRPERIRRLSQTHPSRKLPGIRLFYCYRPSAAQKLLTAFKQLHPEAQVPWFNFEDLINLQMLPEKLY